MIKEIKDMDDEELRNYLNSLRLTRKTGYDREIKIRTQKKSIPECLVGVDDALAALVLAELEKKK